MEVSRLAPLITLPFPANKEMLVVQKSDMFWQPVFYQSECIYTNKTPRFFNYPSNQSDCLKVTYNVTPRDPSLSAGHPRLLANNTRDYWPTIPATRFLPATRPASPDTRQSFIPGRVLAPRVLSICRPGVKQIITAGRE
ncbi:hypothetical protein J6590_020241 [Homalodisca vitripennis]|nr:hypothetical protein J6590_020241 [Homalodisca vitripennis]